MGIRLIVEVMDHWKDAGLTAGERDDLYVLAENANDSTRLTWGSVHAPYILARANKTPNSWKNSIGKLIKKKVITQHVAGHTGQVAVYHLTPLCADPPHDGYQGHCTRPDRVTSQMTQKGHASGDPTDEEYEGGQETLGHLPDDPEGREGHLSGDDRVTSQVTPSPPTPPTTPSTSAPGAASKSKKRAKKAAAKPDPHQVADDLAAAFWLKHGKGRAQPFVAVRGIIRTAIKNGVERDDLARALHRVAQQGRAISGATLDIALGEIRQRHGPYQDPENQDLYDQEVS
ncbi:hypothetical protein [Streptomyces sp. NPDC044948]|uniref:hypothetical protein n=1 Tax=Streptomyces sp. NPDC044948 TaxID=3157092 RepID=UPI0033E1AFA2